MLFSVDSFSSELPELDELSLESSSSSSEESDESELLSESSLPELLPED